MQISTICFSVLLSLVLFAIIAMIFVPTMAYAVNHKGHGHGHEHGGSTPFNLKQCVTAPNACFCFGICPPAPEPGPTSGGGGGIRG